MSDAAVSAQSITKIFGPTDGGLRALDDVSVDIRANEFFTLLGPSGCGKTTLLRMIAGFETPTYGNIILDGVDITTEPPFKRPVNTVFQSYALFPHLTVAENVGFGLEMRGRQKKEIAGTVEEVLALVRMEQMAGRYPSQLSGGQQQRVALARALAPRPSVLLLDEPLSALDLKLRKQMQIELKRMQLETGITFVFVTHDQEEALTMSDRIAVMSAGRILQIGAPRDIYNAPANRFVADFIGESNFLPATVADAGSVTLGNGNTAPAVMPAGLEAGTRVTVAIRPEQIDVCAEADGLLAGTVAELVYFGTDMHAHLTLGDGETVVARVTARSEAALEKGGRTGIRFAPGALRVVEDDA
ncbi:ABC transporter ATP-binding protein [Nisaea acidiphila]|uniref:Spermidine/putrescine import ATP-binding protein PotA n=1 Tax=Nisaea acidiphila TaxID=1862145 RepID=A0A9J7AZL8_9PROT|nr:ABC transporter ATP-binding protein [Nisaea acidiphila]UUX51865.1 ABC transporter ATP-binding protein [Nisaea acidiphila]